MTSPVAMLQIAVLTPWVGSGTEEDPYRPQVNDDHPLISWSDVTAQPAASLIPHPNLLVVEAVIGEGDLAQLQADSRYFVLWCQSYAEKSPR